MEVHEQDAAVRITEDDRGDFSRCVAMAAAIGISMDPATERKI